MRNNPDQGPTAAVETTRRDLPTQAGTPDLGKRRLGMRGDTTFPVAAYDGRTVSHCRAVELSATGLVVERGRAVSAEEQQALLRLQLFLPGRGAPIRALARPVRSFGTKQALKFVAISDVDRLTLTEHLDRQSLSVLH